MKNAIALVLALLPAFCIAQDIVGKKWVIKSSHVVVGQDTLTLYLNDGGSHSYQLSQISYEFGGDGRYIGTAIDGSPVAGTWKMLPGKMDLDGSEGEFYPVDAGKFIISTEFNLSDTSGNVVIARSLLSFTEVKTSGLLVLLSPNPFQNALEVRTENGDAFQAAITMQNVTGQTVFSIPERAFQKQERFTIETGNLANGVYFFILKGNGIDERRKIVKTR